MQGGVEILGCEQAWEAEDCHGSEGKSLPMSRQLNFVFSWKMKDLGK